MKEEKPNGSSTSPKTCSASVLFLAKRVWTPLKLEQVLEIAWPVTHLILKGSKSELREVKHFAQSHKASLQIQHPWPWDTTMLAEEV